VGEAATPYRPADAQIAHHLARFVTLVRSLSIDPIVVRQNWLDAYDYTTDKGAAVLNDYARKNDPFARIGKESVTVQITSVVRASDTSFNVRWTERVRQRCARRHRTLERRAFHRPANPAHRTAPAQEPAGYLRQRPVVEPRTGFFRRSQAMKLLSAFTFSADLLALRAALRRASRRRPSRSMSRCRPSRCRSRLPVEVVAVPEPLALPAQLKPLPELTRPHAGAGRREGARFPCQCRGAYRAHARGLRQRDSGVALHRWRALSGLCAPGA
jgi:hypothetical protein